MTSPNPVAAVLDLQRTAVEQAQEATLDVLEVQKELADQFTGNLETIEQAQRQGAEMSRDVAHANVDALANLNPEVDMTEMRDVVDEQFDVFEETHTETWNAVHDAADDGVESFEEAADSYAEFVDASFDSFLDAHEDVGEVASDVVDQSLDAATDAVDQSFDAAAEMAGGPAGN